MACISGRAVAIWGVSDRFIQTLSRSHERRAYVEVLRDGVVVATLNSTQVPDPVTGSLVQSIGGSVQVARQAVRRSGTVNFLDISQDADLTAALDLFQPLVTEIRPWVGVKYWDAPAVPVPVVAVSTPGVPVPSAGSIYWGMYTSSSIATREATVGRTMAIRNKFHNFTDSFPGASETDDAANGRISLDTWQLGLTGGVPISSTTLADIASGVFDSTINAAAAACASYARPMFIRLGHEMNGDWYVWSGEYNPDNFLTGDVSTFESGIAGWLSTGNCTLARSTAQQHSGTASLALTSSAAGDMNAGHCSLANSPTQGLPANPGDRVSAGCWIRAAANARSTKMGIEFIDASNASISTTFGTAVTDSTTGWTYIFVSGAAPAGTTHARARPDVLATGAAAEVHYVDDVTIGLAASGPQNYINAWRHIHDRFAAAGANNVSWVWCPNFNNSPNESWNAFANYYPGDAYVDWIGVDGYNWGTESGHTWQTFSQVFFGAGGVYDTYVGTKPIMMAETASTETGGDKAAWITDMLAQLKTHPAVKALVWFDAAGSSALWPIDSSSPALTAYTNAGNDSYVAATFNSATAQTPRYVVSPPQPETEFVPLGTLVVSGVDTSSYPQVTVQGYDRMWLVGPFTKALSIPKGTVHADAMRIILGQQIPASRLDTGNIMTTEHTTGALLYAEQDDAAQKLADIAATTGQVLYVDPLGRFATVPESSTDDDPVMTYASGWSASAMMRPKRSVDASQAYNAVVFTGEGASTPPVRGYAQDDNPDSATYVGRVGVRPLFASSPLITTADQATLAAHTRLLNILGIPDTITLRVPPNPALESGDVVIATDTSQGIDFPVIIDAFPANMRASDGEQELTCRPRVSR